MKKKGDEPERSKFKFKRTENSVNLSIKIKTNEISIQEEKVTSVKHIFLINKSLNSNNYMSPSDKDNIDPNTFYVIFSNCSLQLLLVTTLA